MTNIIEPYGLEVCEVKIGRITIGPGFISEARLTLSPGILDALRDAEAFIAEELKVRESSYLPTPTDDEQADLADAQRVLDSVRAAMGKAVA